jgi:hypothetical protein
LNNLVVAVGNAARRAWFMPAVSPGSGVSYRFFHPSAKVMVTVRAEVLAILATTPCSRWSWRIAPSMASRAWTEGGAAGAGEASPARRARGSSRIL